MRIGELVTVGEGETPIENFQYSPWMPFWQFIRKEENHFCEIETRWCTERHCQNYKESRQRSKRRPHIYKLKVNVYNR